MFDELTELKNKLKHHQEVVNMLEKEIKEKEKPMRIKAAQKFMKDTFDISSEILDEIVDETHDEAHDTVSEYRPDSSYTYTIIFKDFSIESRCKVSHDQNEFELYMYNDMANRSDNFTALMYTMDGTTERQKFDKIVNKLYVKNPLVKPMVDKIFQKIEECDEDEYEFEKCFPTPTDFDY